MADEHTYYLRQRPLPVSVSDQSLSTVDTPISSVAVSTGSTRLNPIPTLERIRGRPLGPYTRKEDL